MDIEAQTSTLAFDHFSKTAEVEGELVDVIVDRNVELVDVDGNVRHYAAIVYAKSGCLPEWDAGARLETCDVVLYLRQLLSDDGYIQIIEASQ